MNNLLFYIKKYTKITVNILAKHFLKFKINFTFAQNNNQNDRVTIAILGDYLNCSFLFDSKELDNCEVGFILTKRYPFYTFLFKRRWRKIAFLKQCSDFSENNYQKLLDYCKRKNIDYVLIQAGDFLVPAYNYLNSQLNNKGNGLKAVRCSLDKDYMRTCLNKNGISFVNKKTIHSISDINDVNFYPCVIKPNIGTGSEGVVLVNSSDEMHKALSDAQNEKRMTEFETSFLAEEYIVGRQYDIEGILVNGEVFILCIIAENYQGFFPYFNINWFLFNTKIPASVSEKIKNTLQSAFNMCGLKHGAYHCELKVNDAGEIKIIEFSNRMGGGFEPPISRATGNHFADLYICSMLDKEVKIQHNKNIFLLEKYFRNTTELNSWKAYLKEKGIDYSYKPWVTRGQIAVIKIWHNDEAIIKRITKKFGVA